MPRRSRSTLNRLLSVVSSGRKHQILAGCERAYREGERAVTALVSLEGLLCLRIGETTVCRQNI
jgi:hypothetical protein